MTERETLDREIYAQDRIIKDDEAALQSGKASARDRRLLQLQIGIRRARILKDGAARDEALKRRNSAVREALGMTPTPKPDTEQSSEQKVDEPSG